MTKRLLVLIDTSGSPPHCGVRKTHTEDLAVGAVIKTNRRTLTLGHGARLAAVTQSQKVDLGVVCHYIASRTILNNRKYYIEIPVIILILRE